MKNEKSPGPDGLPAEFYKRFSYLFGDAFVDMVNEVFETASALPITMRLQSYITLLCKRPEQAWLLNNWRPISLLNVDYKIISKVLINRIRLIINRLVNVNQTSAVPGRSVLHNMSSIRDIMAYYKETNRDLYILTVDQAKAFDRVEHSFLHRVIDKFGFGTGFTRWIRLLYTDISSKVLVNRYLTDSFSVQRSVRQGCSLSPALYVLCFEVLALRLRADIIYKGIRLPDGITEVRIIAHADDATLFTENADAVK
jgi:hypothetical protein